MEYDVSLQTIGWINELKNNGTLEINPDFQRRAVWLEKERSQLMNTVIEKLPFPEVYFQILTENETGKQNYVVVDGQQRITSILMYINNEFPLPDKGIFPGRYFKDLDPIVKEHFWNYKVVIRFLKLTNDSEIRDLFQRLNTNNMKLTDQELRNARYVGAFKDLCERIADSPFFQSISLFSSREVRRMADIEFVSELVLQQIYGITNKKDMLEVAYSKYDEELPNESNIEEEFEIVLSLLRTLIDTSNVMVIKTKSNFYSLFGAVLQYYRETSNTVFNDIESTKRSISLLLQQVREDGEGSEVDEVREYAECYNRAASDKLRRIRRQEIIRKKIN